MANRWVLGARPRTLPASAAPVIVGTAVAAHEGDVVWWRAVAAMMVALAIQVGTNYFNDVADGVRGTDATRVGPVRLVASGLAPPRAVRLAGLGAFGVAGIAGAALAVAVGPELFVVGAASFAAGYLYTGGPRPYGYAGLGEAFVFVFFGLVATTGSAYVHLERLTALSWWAAVPMGCCSTAILVANNLRDIPTDAVAGKRTLAVCLGERATRRLYSALVVAAFAALGPVAATSQAGALVGLVAVAVAWRPLRAVLGGAAGRALIPVLGATGKLQLALGVTMAAGLAA